MRNVAQLDRVFYAIGNKTRRAILANLAEGEQSTGAIAKEFTLSRPAISKHLGVLKAAGLVRRRHEGRNQIYTLEAEPLLAARNWLSRYERFWQLSMTRLQQHLEQED